MDAVQAAAAERILKTLIDQAHQQGDGPRAHLLQDLRIILVGTSEVDGLVQVERDLVEQGKPIHAVKELRSRFLTTGDPRGTLKGAKDAVDAYISKHPRSTP